MDFNDLHRLRSLKAVRAVVEAARKQDGDCPIPEGFFLVLEDKCAELYKLETKLDEEMNGIRIGPPLAVKDMTRDSEAMNGAPYSNGLTRTARSTPGPCPLNCSFGRARTGTAPWIPTAGSGGSSSDKTTAL